MRRLAACLILCLALAAPAAAQQKGRITMIEPEKAALRGPVGGPAPAEESEAPEPEPEAPLLPPLPVQPTPVSSSADAGRCRMTCSKDYYFCLAGEDDLCPQYWSRCITGCAG